MPVFSPEQLQVWTAGRWVGGVPERVTGFGNDTRALKPGEMFVALKTASRDGHDFLNDAAARGASCALVSREVAGSPVPQLVVSDTLESLQRVAAVWREKFKNPVYAVTGSVGKTSTKDLLKRILGPDTHATHANLNNLLGVPLTLLGIEPAHVAAVIEAGMSEPGELERSAWIIRPDIAVVTNVQPAHLQGLGSMEAIAREKSALCRQTSARGLSVFPAECLDYDSFNRLLGRRVPVVFGDAPAPEKRDGIHDVVRAEISRAGSGHLLKLTGGLFGAHEFTVGEVSDGMARNAALAATAALLGGVSPESIRNALTTWTPSAGRGELRESAGKLFYVDCYNASPASMADAAGCFVRRTPDAKPRLFVLGGMNELGDDAIALHREVGRKLPLRPGDALALFGGLSAEIGVGAAGAGFSAGAVKSYDSVDTLREAIAAFSGSVMLKGSRGYALERALPADIGGDAIGH
jgi:UDP-N-acetylmuramoyl-tripeptide--D-alanyl-D-alanine ligase